MIIVEDFSLSTTIAGNCDLKTDTPRDGDCALSWEDEFFGTVFVFTSAVSACAYPEDDGEYNGICYHVPIDSSKLFNS